MLNNNRTRWILAIAGVATIGPDTQADIVNLVSAHDNTLYDDPTGSLSNGSGQFCFVGETGTGLRRRALMKFDLSAVPAGATINNVTLTLHMSMGANTNPTDVSVFRALADWGEGASVAPGNGGGGTAAATGDATWLHTFFNTSLWATPGGDFAASSSATTSVSVVNSYSWSSAELLADVQQWAAAPASNFGWLLRGDETNAGSSKRFDTRENTTASFRPTLIVDFTPVPAPGAILVMLMGAFIPACRRRDS